MLVTWWRHYYVAFFSWLDAFTNVIVRAECLNSCCGIVGAGGLRRRLGRGGGGRRRWSGGARRQAAASRVVSPSSVSRNITLTSSPVSQLCTASDVPVKLPNVRWVNYTQSSRMWLRWPSVALDPATESFGYDAVWATEEYCVCRDLGSIYVFCEGVRMYEMRFCDF